LTVLLTETPINLFKLQANENVPIYQDIRLYSGGFVGTEQIEIPSQEIDYLMNWRNYQKSRVSGFRSNSNEPLTAGGFTVTTIRNSGLTHEESIVIILFGDAFTEEQYGTWPYPATGTVLWHADAVINTMFNTHPYD
jgi:hypothetical protein